MRLLIALLITLAVPSAAAAFPDQDTWNTEVDPKEQARLEAVRDLIEAEKFAQAIPPLRDLTREMPENADLFNWLGFAYRKTGDLKNSAVAYEKALSLEPDHMQALEYQGELFLALDDLARAEANLRRIEALCAWPCEEKKALEKAIAEWRAEKSG